MAGSGTKSTTAIFCFDMHYQPQSPKLLEYLKPSLLPQHPDKIKPGIQNPIIKKFYDNGHFIRNKKKSYGSCKNPIIILQITIH